MAPCLLVGGTGPLFKAGSLIQFILKTFPFSPSLYFHVRKVPDVRLPQVAEVRVRGEPPVKDGESASAIGSRPGHGYPCGDGASRHSQRT